MWQEEKTANGTKIIILSQGMDEVFFHSIMYNDYYIFDDMIMIIMMIIMIVISFDYYIFLYLTI